MNSWPWSGSPVLSHYHNHLHNHNQSHFSAGELIHQDQLILFVLHLIPAGPPWKEQAYLCVTDGSSYLLICCDTCGTKNLLGLARARATIAVASTVLATVHGEVVGGVKFWKTGITTKTMHHILIFNFKSNLGNKNTYTSKISKAN